MTARRMRARFTRTQILGFLREAAAGTPVMELCWNHCFSRSTFRAWKAKYGTAAEANRFAQLRSENERLRDGLASAAAEIERLRRQTSPSRAGHSRDASNARAGGMAKS